MPRRQRQEQLCSKVMCLSGVCEMRQIGITVTASDDPPNVPANPNQWFRLFTSLMIHAGEQAGRRNIGEGLAWVAKCCCAPTLMHVAKSSYFAIYRSHSNVCPADHPALHWPKHRKEGRLTASFVHATYASPLSFQSTSKTPRILISFAPPLPVLLSTQAGPLRVALIYIISGVGGNLIAGIFAPYDVTTGCDPAVYGLLGVMLVELFQSWQVVERPYLELAKVGGLCFILLFIGTFPFLDNWSHVGGFLFGKWRRHFQRFLRAIFLNFEETLHPPVPHLLRLFFMPPVV